MGKQFTRLCGGLLAALTLALAPNANAREVLDASELRSPYDWTQADRRDWSARSARDNRAELAADLAAARQSNTFVKSALANTQRLRAAEYRTGEQRHAYYDLMAQVLECSDIVALRGIRYFHSAAAAAGHDATGSAGSLPGSLLGADARSLLEEIHRALFRANFRILRSLLFDWRSPRQPATEGSTSADDAQPVTPIVFDVAMVDREQALIERQLAARGYPAETIARINLFVGLKPSVWARSYSPYEVARRWTRRAGYAKEDYASRAWRVAMGRALLLYFHGHREEQHGEDALAQAALIRNGKHHM